MSETACVTELLPSLRDLAPLLALVPALKCWAIFGEFGSEILVHYTNPKNGNEGVSRA